MENLTFAMQIAIKVIMKDVLPSIFALMHNFTVYAGTNCVCMYVIYFHTSCYTIFIYSKKYNQNKMFYCVTSNLVTSTRHEPVYVPPSP